MRKPSSLSAEKRTASRYRISYLRWFAVIQTLRSRSATATRDKYTAPTADRVTRRRSPPPHLDTYHHRTSSGRENFIPYNLYGLRYEFSLIWFFRVRSTRQQLPVSTMNFTKIKRSRTTQRPTSVYGPPFSHYLQVTTNNLYRRAKTPIQMPLV